MMKNVTGKLKKYKTGVASGILLLSSFASAFAATAPSITVSPNDITTGLCTAVNWMFFGLITLSSIMVLVGAYLYVTSSGNPEKTSKAYKTILYAMLGVVIALIAKSFPISVGKFIGASLTGGC